MTFEDMIIDAFDMEEVMDSSLAVGRLWESYHNGEMIVREKVEALLPSMDWDTAPLTEQQDRAFLIHWITGKIMERIIEVDLQPNQKNQPWGIEDVAKRVCENLTKEQLDGWCNVEKMFEEEMEG